MPCAFLWAHVAGSLVRLQQWLVHAVVCMAVSQCMSSGEESFQCRSLAEGAHRWGCRVDGGCSVDGAGHCRWAGHNCHGHHNWLLLQGLQLRRHLDRPPNLTLHLVTSYQSRLNISSLGLTKSLHPFTAARNFWTAFTAGPSISPGQKSRRAWI